MLGERIRVKTALGPEPCLIRVDLGQIEQVVMNLAVNARDAMPDGGTISIGVEQRKPAPAAPGAASADLRSEPHVALWVSDEGAGIAPEIQAHVFEPFFTTKGSGKGTGIGLSVVLAIVEGASGQIRLESGAGRGTTFEVLLPRASAPEASAPKSIPPPNATGARARVLVLEDELPVRTTVRRILERAGFETAEAQSGAEAEAILARGPVDLILSDVILPRQTGPEIVEQLEARFGPQRVVFMSGYAADALEERLASRREVLLIAKPFSKRELLAAVRRALPTSSAAEIEASGESNLRA
jgi:two-component system cell cycle sensor histidine kinase/response regulator CckA